MPVTESFTWEQMEAKIEATVKELVKRLRANGFKIGPNDFDKNSLRQVNGQCISAKFDAIRINRYRTTTGYNGVVTVRWSNGYRSSATAFRERKTGFPYDEVMEAIDRKVKSEIQNAESHRLSEAQEEVTDKDVAALNKQFPDFHVSGQRGHTWAATCHLHFDSRAQAEKVLAAATAIMRTKG